MQGTFSSRGLPALAIGGALLLFVGTYLHPSSADPNVPLAAFAEYESIFPSSALVLLRMIGLGVWAWRRPSL